MSPVKQRLNALWLRQTCIPFSPRAIPDQYSAKIFVKVREPLQIPGGVLPPGIYVFRPFDVGADCDLVQILNEDQTELIATFTTAPDS
jgi:hypothetical protein